MSKLYLKHDSRKKRLLARFLGLFLLGSGIIFLAYFAFPVISWQIYFQQAFAEQDLASPIPKTAILTPSSIQSLIAATTSSLQGVDYTKAKNWFPTVSQSTSKNPKPQVISVKALPPSTYSLSIPKLHIENASVSTVDDDLTKHLINFAGTAVPPDKGNAVVFGHSTLPQLFNPKDYTTILANAHTLRVNDIFLVTVNNTTYTYKIFSISIIDPTDTAVLEQTYDDSYFTLITCTPPGTVWKRLVLKSRLVKS